MKQKYFFLILLICINVFDATAQRLRFTNISIGYKIFETEPIGNNPTTIAPLVKNSVAFENYLASFRYTGITGNPAIQRLPTYYINAEVGKRSSSRFWKHYTLQFGIHLTNQLTKDNMAVDRQEAIYTPVDTSYITTQYSLVQQQQFAGLNVGINRRFRLGKTLLFVTGLHLQGSIAFIHNYQQQVDSTVVSFRYLNYNRSTTSAQLSERLKGKNFFQWQAMIPFGLEVNIYKRKLFVRGEAELGIIGGKYRAKGTTTEEALGLGAWLVYKL